MGGHPGVAVGRQGCRVRWPTTPPCPPSLLCGQRGLPSLLRPSKGAQGVGALGEGPGQWGGGAGGLSHPPSGGLQGLGKVSGSSPLTLRTVGWALGCGQSYSSAPGAPPDPPQGLGGGQIESIRGPLPQRDPLSSPKTGQQSCVRVGARPGCPWGQRCIWGGWGCSLGLQPCSRLHAPCP